MLHGIRRTWRLYKSLIAVPKKKGDRAAGEVCDCEVELPLVIEILRYDRGRIIPHWDRSRRPKGGSARAHPRIGGGTY